MLVVLVVLIIPMAVQRLAAALAVLETTPMVEQSLVVLVVQIILEQAQM